MHHSTDDLVLLGLLLGAAGLLVLAYRLKVPYPILLVVGGAALGFIPGLPAVELPPDAILILFLPPLLYAAAFFSSLRDLRAQAGDIGMLAIGLVVITTLVVGVVAHAWIDDLSWGAAFTLGAILAPTDPVAATSIAARAGAPRRFRTTVEGEALVNDSSGLIVYKVALAAALTGSFSLLDAGAAFVLEAVGGVAIGVAVGVVVARVRRVVDDAPTEITISLLTPFFAYLPAQSLGLSAVLAAVTSGVWLGWRAPQLVTPSVRLPLYSVWEIVTFVLNAALFVLVGLQLRGIVERIGGSYSAADLAAWAALTFLAVVVARVVFTQALAGARRRLSAAARRDGGSSRRAALLEGWCGMRGAVSLAAALALPITPELPSRDLIVFLVFAVLLASLVLEGLTLEPLIRVLRLPSDDHAAHFEAKARIKAAKAAIARIDELAAEDWVLPETAERARGLHEFRLKRFMARFDTTDDGSIDQRSINFQHLQREVLDAQRRELLRLRDGSPISDEVLRRVERDLDLEDERLDIGNGPGMPAAAPIAATARREEDEEGDDERPYAALHAAAR